MNSYLNNRQYGFVLSNKNLYLFFLQIYFICLPLNAVTIGTMGSVLKYIAILPIGISLLSLKFIRFNSVIMAQLGFVIWAAFSCMWSVNTSMSIDRTVSYVLLTALVFSCNTFDFTYEDIKKIKKAFLWSSRSTAVVMLVFSEYSSGRFMLGGKISEDPNYLCGYLFAGIVLSLQSILLKRKRMFSLIELIIYLFLVLQTGSRGGLLAAAFSAVCYIFFYKKAAVNEILKKFFYVILMFIIVLVVLQFLPEELTARFNYKDAIASGGTGRFEIWEAGIKLFKNFPLHRQIFGTGTGTITAVLILTEYGITRGTAMHNIFLETLVELGVVGFIIYIIWVGIFVISAFKEKDKFAFAVIMGMIVLSLSTSLHTFKPYFNIMLMILAFKNQIKSDESEEQAEIII